MDRISNTSKLLLNRMEVEDSISRDLRVMDHHSNHSIPNTEVVVVAEISITKIHNLITMEAVDTMSQLGTEDKNHLIMEAAGEVETGGVDMVVEADSEEAMEEVEAGDLLKNLGKRSLAEIVEVVVIIEVAMVVEARTKMDINKTYKRVSKSKVSNLSAKNLRKRL